MQSDKQPNTQSKEKNVVETSIKPSFPLISNQPERYGALSEAFLFVEEKRIFDLLNEGKKYAFFAGVLLMIPIAGFVAARIMTGEPLAGTLMGVAKIIFSYFLLGGTGALAGIWYFRHKIMEILAQLEDLAYFGDDMARFYMPYARSELKDLNERLRKHQEDPTMPSTVEIARDLWPVVQMILKRDPNVIKWASVGLKVYKTVSAFFKGQNNTSETT